MPLNASKIKSQAKPRVQQEEMAVGNYMSRVAQVIDTGVRPREKWDPVAKAYVIDTDKAPAQSMMITYEFLTEFVKDENGVDQEDKPRWLSESLFLFGLDVDLATSTKRYKAIDPELKMGGDWTLLAEAPCMVTIVHKTNGKAKIGSVGGAPKGLPFPELKNPSKVFLMDNPDMEVFNSLPEWLQEKIKEAINFKGSALEAALNGGEAKPTEEETPPASGATETTQSPAESVAEEPALDDDEDDMPW